jgi:hypothetical protein
LVGRRDGGACDAYRGHDDNHPLIYLDSKFVGQRAREGQSRSWPIESNYSHPKARLRFGVGTHRPKSKHGPAAFCPEPAWLGVLFSGERRALLAAGTRVAV